MKTLVIYYSASGHTKRIATEIAQNLDADTFEILPAKAYTNEDLDWTDTESRVSHEYEDSKLRDVELKTTEVPNWSEYDRVIIGYPIWYGIAAWPTNAFIKTLDFANKTVIPFCCSHSSELGNSDLKLKDDAKGGEWRDGHRFFQDAPSSAIKTWTESL
ncbi:flavodoxin [Candidatus Saccharibacteria bacterium]|nr:flavodoxin [Candidatus Saccharibacteria bacterium]